MFVAGKTPIPNDVTSPQITALVSELFLQTYGAVSTSATVNPDAPNSEASAENSKDPKVPGMITTVWSLVKNGPHNAANGRCAYAGTISSKILEKESPSFGSIVILGGVIVVVVVLYSNSS